MKMHRWTTSFIFAALLSNMNWASAAGPNDRATMKVSIPLTVTNLPNLILSIQCLPIHTNYINGGGLDLTNAYIGDLSPISTIENMGNVEPFRVSVPIQGGSYSGILNLVSDMPPMPDIVFKVDTSQPGLSSDIVSGNAWQATGTYSYPDTLECEIFVNNGPSWVELVPENDDRCKTGTTPIPKNPRYGRSFGAAVCLGAGSTDSSYLKSNKFRLATGVPRPK